MTTTPESTRRAFAHYAVNVDHLSDDEVERLYETLTTISLRMEAPLNQALVSLAALQRRPAMNDIAALLASASA